MIQRLSLRQRNRLATMRLVQETAVTLFESDGFEATTVEQIAETIAVSPSTVYRHFGTKENLVLWDEQDQVVDAELARRLPREPTVDAFRNAAIRALVDRRDRSLFLRRLKLVYAVPQIWAAAAQQDRIARKDLAAAIASTDRRSHVTTADTVIAAVCLAALDVALDTWQDNDGKERLDDLISQSISAAVSRT